MIFKAKHPVILVGHSAVRNHAGEALTSFADVLKIPVGQYYDGQRHHSL